MPTKPKPFSQIYNYVVGWPGFHILGKPWKDPKEDVCSLLNNSVTAT